MRTNPKEPEVGSWVLNLIPRSTFSRCLVAVVFGGVVGLVWKEGAGLLQPLANLCVRMMTLVVFPFMILEVVTCLADMKSTSRIILLRQGGWILLGLLGLAVVAVCGLPGMLPPLLSSPLFDPQILEKPPGAEVWSFLIPENIFNALAGGNFAGTAFCSAVVGLVLQKMPNREPVLVLLRPLRALSLNLLKWVVDKISPTGIFALTATTLVQREAVNVERLTGFVSMMAVALLVVGGLILPGLVAGLTQVSWNRWWRILKEPLILVACTGQVFLSIPIVLASLRTEVWDSLPGKGKKEGLEAAEAFVILGYSLFSLGKWILLVFLPFAAWYYDSPIGLAEILRTLMTAIPASIGGVYLAIVQELPRLGLPTGLGNFYLLNYAWAARCGDVLTLLGTFAGAVLLCAYAKGQLQLQTIRLAGWLVTGSLAGLLAGAAVHRVLAETLKDSQGTRQIVLGRSSVVEGPTPIRLATPPEPAPPTLAGIQARGVLRVGLLEPSVPWAYLNGKGELVGYDVDLLKALAAAMKVRLELISGNKNQLLLWLEEKRVDLAAGGILASTVSGWEKLQYVGYENAHLALLVEDAKVNMVQEMFQGGAAKELRLNLSEAVSHAPELEWAIKSQISKGKEDSCKVILSRASPGGRRDAGESCDGVLTTAEGGSAEAVLYPRFSMVPAFGKRLTVAVGLVAESSDDKFRLFLENWVETNRNLGLFLRLRRHWIEFR